MAAISKAELSVSEHFSMFFHDRREAGCVLGGLLNNYANQPETVVLGLPRGGVVVANEVARILGAPLDVFLVRKLGAPHQPELAMGAVASGGVRVLNPAVMDQFGISQEQLEETTQQECKELKRREQAYRGSRPAQDLQNRVVILVDDGLATGSTMQAAIAALHQHSPKQIIAAVPVAAVNAVERLEQEVEVVAAMTPTPFFAVGRWYRDFSPVMDREIHQIFSKPPTRSAGD
jgi:putative phosphoribosyl transferase